MNDAIWNETIVGSINENEKIKKSDKLPYGYYLPQKEGKVYWVCARDKDGVIVSTFYNDEIEDGMLDEDGEQIEESMSTILPSEKEALKHRNTLTDAGWLEMKMPGKKFLSSDGVEINISNRKNKRKIQRRTRQNKDTNTAVKKEMADAEKARRKVKKNQRK